MLSKTNLPSVRRCTRSGACQTRRNRSARAVSCSADGAPRPWARFGAAAAYSTMLHQTTHSLQRRRAHVAKMPQWCMLQRHCRYVATTVQSRLQHAASKLQRSAACCNLCVHVATIVCCNRAVCKHCMSQPCSTRCCSGTVCCNGARCNYFALTAVCNRQQTAVATATGCTYNAAANPHLL